MSLGKSYTYNTFPTNSKKNRTLFQNIGLSYIFKNFKQTLLIFNKKAVLFYLKHYAG